MTEISKLNLLFRVTAHECEINRIIHQKLEMSTLLLFDLSLRGAHRSIRTIPMSSNWVNTVVRNVQVPPLHSCCICSLLKTLDSAKRNLLRQRILIESKYRLRTTTVSQLLDIGVDAVPCCAPRSDELNADQVNICSFWVGYDSVAFNTRFKTD